MKKLHLICNAHIDPIWQWTWDEGISSALSTFKSAVNLAKDFDYIFCHGESLLYEAIEKHDPELFAEIQQLVKQGKWQITCGWYLQPDCLFPVGETFVRHIAVGKKYFKEKFGVEPTVVTSLDAFGHSVGLVQILAKNGYNGYLHCRPFGSQFDYPSLFYNWVGPDGSKLIGARYYGYGSGLGKATEKINLMVSDMETKDFLKEDEVCYLMWGVGNHGGGPSRKDLTDIANYKHDGIEVFHSTPEALFNDNIRVGGTFNGSLVTCMPGCYSSMARVKQAYRRTENFFYSTEKMLATARLAGFEVNTSMMDDAEKKMLLTTFHDILPGSCVEEGEKEGLGQLYACDRILRDYRTDTFLQMVMKQRRAEIGEYPVFVYNYLPYENDALIEVEFSAEDQNWSKEKHYKIHVYDENGIEVVSQRIKEDSTLNLDWRKRIVFEGKLKPLGITRFTVKLDMGEVKDWNSRPIDNLNGVLDGELLTAPVSLEVYDDTADPWGMSDAELKQMGTNPVPFREMTASEVKDFFASSKEVAPIRVIEDGDILQKTECVYTASKTNAVVDYITYKNRPYTDIKLTVEFAEKNKLIRLKVPVPKEFKNCVTVGDGPFVWEEKPNVEVTFQKWLGAKNSSDEIFAIINDGVYAGKADGEYLYLTLLRGSGYCFHPIEDRPLYPEDRYLPRIDCGRYVYNLRLFKGKVYEVTKMAEEFNATPYAINVFPTGEVNSIDVPTVTLKGEVILTTVKPTKNDIVMRVYNPSDTEKTFTLNVGSDTYSSIANKREVVSIRYSNGKFTKMDKMTI